MIALLITLGLSLVLFLGSLVSGLVQDNDTGRYYQYLMGTEEKMPVQASFDRAARMPTRILGTYIC